MTATTLETRPSEIPPSRVEVRAEYTRRLEQRRATRNRYARLDYVIGNGRLAIFALGVVMAILSIGYGMFSAWWIVVPLAVFVALVVRHDRVIRLRQRADRAVAFYENGLLRLADRWAGRGVLDKRFASASHPYAEDLDLFGRGSLFELLCTARTRGGEDCLAAWLLAPASPEVIRARQEAIIELRPRLDLREDLALLGEEARSAIDPVALSAWGRAPGVVISPAARVAALLIALGTVAAAILWQQGWGPIPFLALSVIGQLFRRAWRDRVAHVLKAVENPARDLDLLSSLLARLEAETFQAPRLRELRAALDVEGITPSASIAHLQTLNGYLDAWEMQLVKPVLLLLLWTTQFAFALEGWRARYGPHLDGWLQTIGEFEALSALASYAYENPEDPFPELVEGAPCVEAEGLAHPLLPTAQVVRNDVRLDETTRLLIVSGSNMSGKSTLLRTLGVNVVLALAGAPVRAHHLRLTPVHLGASIRTQDSLQAGISRFYAEILRLRQVVDIAETSPPLLFLLDEILHGTNSHDRRVGAEAVVRALLARGALGLITTHDLALARIAEDRSLAAANVHFEDQLENGKMSFDYHLRPGVVTKSNAIELMRAVGLEV